MLRRWGAKPWAALLLTLATIYLILIGLVGGGGVLLARLATVLPQYKGRAQELVDNVSQALSNLGIGGQQINAALGERRHRQGRVRAARTSWTGCSR